MSPRNERDPATFPEMSGERRPRLGGELLLVVITEDAVTTHPLRRGAMVIGRGQEADIRIDSGAVSRRHARLFVDERVRIEDCGSRNGTFVRGAALAPGALAEVTPSDLVELGASVSLVVQARLAARPDAGAEPYLGDLERLIPRIAKSAISVVIAGETGTGKEVLAKRLHAESPRGAGPWVAINCAAVSEALLESELFGYERGAFTGAAQSKVGLLEAAHGGTLFLDEVGEMPPALQAKLLRVLEQREVLPVGSTRPRAIDVRVLAATHRDLAEEVRAGRFRRDLWFRLNGITVTAPPLRSRPAEIEPLARQFAAEAARESGYSAVPRFSPEALAALRGHLWPGNIRELKNVVRRAVVLAARGEIHPEHLWLEPWAPAGSAPAPSAPAPSAPAPSAPAPSAPAPAAAGPALRSELREVERQRIVEALEACGGNQSRAAKVLQIARGTLIARMEEYGLSRPRKR